MAGQQYTGESDRPSFVTDCICWTGLALSAEPFAWIVQLEAGRGSTDMGRDGGCVTHTESAATSITADATPATVETIASQNTNPLLQSSTILTVKGSGPDMKT